MDSERNERVAKNEHPLVLGIPLVVGVTVVGVQPPIVVVVFDVEHVQVTIGTKYAEDHLEHCPLKYLRAEFYT